MADVLQEYEPRIKKLIQSSGMLRDLTTETLVAK